MRTVDGTEVPAAGRWRVPSSYVAVSFRGGGRLVRRVHGRLRADDGLIVIGDDPLSSTIDLPIDVTTIRTGHSRLDHELGHRLGDALGAPIVAFHGRLQGCLSLDEWTVTGALRGPALTLPTSATATYRGVFRRPGGAGALWLTAAATVDRHRIGATAGCRIVPLAARRPVTIGIDLLAVGPDRERRSPVARRRIHGRVSLAR